MTIVVTGANGFVGQAMVRHLAAQGQTVRACVRAGRTLDSLPGNLSIVAHGDLDANTDWTHALSGATTVVHTAARVHVMQDTAIDPIAEFRRVNAPGTVHLASEAARLGVKRFIFVSSIKVNGEATVPGGPFTADDAAHPADPYGISKHEAEIGLRRLVQETGIEVVIVRPPLVYGPGVKGNFAAMMRALGRGLPLPLGAVTGNRRSLVALDNLVDLLATCVDHPAVANQTLLVCDGEDLSTADLMRRTGQALGKPARLLPVPIPLLQSCARLLGKGDAMHRLLSNLQVDISKTRQLLSWTPPISVDEGLRRAARGFFK